MSDEPRRLVLMRHAKSDWSTFGQEDHDRPLNLRGRLAAPLMGAWLAEQPWSIDLALVSSAARTQETWARLAPMLPEKPAFRTEAALYHAEPETTLQLLRAAPAEAAVVLMIGHNPGMEALAARLTPAGAATATRFPTAAIGVFRLEAADWSAAGYGRFTLEAFEQPKSLV